MYFGTNIKRHNIVIYENLQNKEDFLEDFVS